MEIVLGALLLLVTVVLCLPPISLYSFTVSPFIKISKEIRASFTEIWDVDGS